MNAQTSETTAAEMDELAIEAVRNGDTERYGELVERHERKVYAVAWCRLGDQDMAEEATQEAFIKAFRQLPLLGQGGKFAEWITAIGRNAAINIGLRRRNELERCQRWAVEQPSVSSPDHEEHPVSTDVLKATLSALPEPQRECLVLFYLQDQTVSQAAASLGISETAFKTRLHRARTLLRDRLAETLEGALDTLGPGVALAPPIMAIVLANKAEAATVAGGGSGVLLKIGGVAAKILPFGLFSLLLPMLSLIPAFFLRRKQAAWEQSNYKDPEGFRARIHRQLSKKYWMVPLFFSVPLILGTRFGSRMMEIEGMMKVCGVAFGLQLLVMIRASRLINNAYQKAQILGLATLVLSFLAIGFLHLPWQGLLVFQVFFFLVMGITMGKQPRKLDYSLFLRAGHGLLGGEGGTTRSSRTISEDELFRFARELGKRWLARDYKWTESSLILRLAPIESSVLNPSLPGFWGDSSTLTLYRNGEIKANLSRKDLLAIQKSTQNQTQKTDDLERTVTASVKSAFAAFQKTDFSRLESVLGEQSDAEIFHQPPGKSKSVTNSRRAIFVCVAIMIAGSSFVWWTTAQPHLPHAPKPVSITPVQATEALSGKTGSLWKAGGPNEYTLTGLDLSIVHPPKTLVPVEYLTTLLNDGLPARGTSERTNQIIFQMMTNRRWQQAFMGGALTKSDLAMEGVNSDTIRELFRHDGSGGLNEFLKLTEAQVTHPDREPGKGVAPSWTFPRMAVLAAFDRLDLVDKGAVIQRLKSCQVESGTYTNDVTVEHFDRTRGLFLCWSTQAIKDTYYSLAVLDTLGGLDSIDGESCVRGILRYHRGNGLFLADIQADGLYLTGDAQETLCAYESLRILKALDRVPDLKHWKFRPMTFRKSAEPMDWPTIGAWMLQSRLDKLATGNLPPNDWPTLLKETDLRTTVTP